MQDGEVVIHQGTSQENYGHVIENVNEEVVSEPDLVPESRPPPPKMTLMYQQSQINQNDRHVNIRACEFNNN